MVKKTNHRLSFTLKKSDYSDFERLYPHCLAQFLRGCVSYALGDKEFFQSIFFHELDNSLENYVVNKMINRLDGVLD